jgi:aryl sulfotransferase
MGRPRYRGIVYDSARWDGFETRPGDIFVCTPPKCGTTWMQMVLALLVFQRPDLPDRLSKLSPWVDMVTRSRTEVFADLEAQEHRRFIKTHTPLDGIPNDPHVTYVVVGRDPRDVSLSMANHLANLDMAEVAAARARAAEVDGVELEPLVPPPPSTDDPAERFWSWVEADTDPGSSVPSLRLLTTHLTSFWEARDRLDVALCHYDDLLVDLPGEMRRLATHLGIAVPEDRWPALVEAATLDSMRARAGDVVPGADRSHWKDVQRFFNRGTSGQWRDLIDDEGVARYADRVRSLAPPDLVDWLHHADPLPI